MDLDPVDKDTLLIDALDEWLEREVTARIMVLDQLDQKILADIRGCIQNTYIRTLSDDELSRLIHVAESL
jgi:hypothetical protein